VEIRIEWRIMLIHFVHITPGCIRLPDLDQGVANRLTPSSIPSRSR
jgi:hypothetical protein